MKIKPIHIIGILVIVLITCSVVGTLYQRREMDPVVVYKTVTHTPRKPHAVLEKSVATTSTTQSTKSEETGHNIHSMAEGSRKAILSIYQQEGEPLSPRALALEKAMNSPEFLEYVEKQNRDPSFSFRLWYDFLESQGLRSSRYLYENRLRRKYNFTQPLSYYEPMMREQMTELFLMAEDPTDRIEVLRQFTAKEENSLWYLAHFGGEGDREWIAEIQQNTANMVASHSSQIVTSQTQQELTSPSDIVNIEKNSVETPSSQRDAPLTEDMSKFNELERLPQISEEIKSVLEQLDPNTLKSPAPTDFETALRDRFSPQRLTTAMKILNQYGSKEGLRRLKESDPDVATQFEGIIQK